MNLTKEAIRRAALNAGGYDLTYDGDRRALEHWVNCYYAWFRSGVWKLLPGSTGIVEGPLGLLARVKPPSHQTRERMAKEVRETLRNWSFVLFTGAGALLAAMAMAKQCCFDLGMAPKHVTTADLLAWPDELLGLGTFSGDTLLLEVLPSGVGNVWIEKSLRVLSLIRSHHGPAIIFTTEKTLGSDELTKILAAHYHSFPRRYEVGL